VPPKRITDPEDAKMPQKNSGTSTSQVDNIENPFYMTVIGSVVNNYNKSEAYVDSDIEESASRMNKVN
jgi:hypothetical protein